MKYDKIIFVCTRNTFLSPVAEAMFRAKAPSWMPASCSRGLVVLFQEPINPKVNLILTKYNIGISKHQFSRQIEPEDITERTLLLTMTLSEKVQLLEMFEGIECVYTVGEYTGTETDILDPCGEGEEAYFSCCEDLLKRIDLVVNCIEQECNASSV